MSKEMKPPDGKEKFIREMIAFLSSDKAVFYVRGDRVYVDTTPMRGAGLLLLEGAELRSFFLKLAKAKDNLLLRGADADLIVDHVRYHAAAVAEPLARDARAHYIKEGLLINTGWVGGKCILITPQGGWGETVPEQPVFEPVGAKNRMVVPAMREAERFPDMIRRGIGDFGENHCLLCATCATLLLPADFSHPFIVFTGHQARGKSTTMKLLMQLTDPYEGAELMTVGEDMRDFISLCRGRHSVALDNVSKLPFDEDLLSKLYSGGLFAARKMTTNSELSEVEMPRLRVMLNGIATSFSRSDLMSRCIFIEHPLFTTRNAEDEMFESLTKVEERWRVMLPEVLGSLLAAVAKGLKEFQKDGGYGDRKSASRFVEYCILGEYFAQAMGYPDGLFTKQVRRAGELQKESALAADDCAQLVVAWLEGERGITQHEVDWETGDRTIVGGAEKKNIVVAKTTELFAAVRELALSRGFSVYSMRWLASVNPFSVALRRGQKNIENAGWKMEQVGYGRYKRNWQFTRI